MKQKIIKMLVLIMLLGVTGCGGNSNSKTGEKVLKAFEDNGYTVYFRDYENDLYYDKKENIYNVEFKDISIPGKKDNTMRYAFKPKELSMEIQKNDEEVFIIKNEAAKPESKDEAFKRIYYVNRMNETYIKRFGEEAEEKVEFDHNYSSKEPYIYFLEENKESRKYIKEEDICGEKSKDSALEVRDTYQKTLEKLDISEDELLVFAEWMNENAKADMLKSIENKFKKQKVLTTAEVAKRVEDAGYEIEELDSDSTYISFEYIGSDYVLIGGKEMIIFYDSKKDEEGNVSYVIEDGEDKLITEKRKEVYNMETEKSETTNKMSKENINSGGFLKYIFDYQILVKAGITKEELVSLFSE